MLFRRFALVALIIGAIPVMLMAQYAEDTASRLFLELNAVRDEGGSCRLTFLARNGTGVAIDKAVFETVIFDTSGGVLSLSLMDFRDLPVEVPRVRQFDLPGMTCDALGQALINGANSCVVDGVESAICHEALSLSSRLSVELLG